MTRFSTKYLLVGLSIAPLLGGCTGTSDPAMSGVGGMSVAGLGGMGPLTPGPASTALSIAAIADPTGIAGMAAGHAYKAEMEAKAAKMRAEGVPGMIDPKAMLAQAEAAKQMGIQNGILNPDGSQKTAQPAEADASASHAENAEPGRRKRRVQGR